MQWKQRVAFEYVLIFSTLFFLGSSANIGICLETIVGRHRVMEVHMKTLTSSLSDCLNQPVQTKLDTWRKKVVQLDKQHAKQFKKMRAVVKKRNEAVGKLRKKVKKRTKDQELVKQLELSERDLMAATEMFVEKEKAAVKDIDGVERAIFSSIAVGFKHIISEEFEMLNQVAKLGEVIATIDEETLLPTNMLERSEYCEDYTADMNKAHVDCTPKMSPYNAKSRSESCKSRNSFSSRHSSVDSLIDDRRSTTLSLHNTMRDEKSCPREDRYSLPIYNQEQQDQWLYCKAGSEEILMAEISSSLLSEPSIETTESFKPLLPQRGKIPEPYYSVPQNNNRVTSTTEEVESIPTFEDIQQQEVDIGGSDSCSS